MFDFEFMDLKWTPQSLKSTLRDILEFMNSKPWRGYNSWMTDKIKQYLLRNIQVEAVVELGAGMAPITKGLLKEEIPRNIIFQVTDLNPITEYYHQLKKVAPNQVFPCEEPVNFAQSIPLLKNQNLLTLSATFHHIPLHQRREVIQNLLLHADHVMIFEPLKNKLSSILFCLGGWVPSILCPLFTLTRKGVMRRIFWCYFLPLAPLLIMWDGIISCLRMTTKEEWESLVVSDSPVRIDVKETFFCQAVTIQKNP